ncbi:MAG: hypothetical protein AB1700_18750 [Bacillota bacterium]
MLQLTRPSQLPVRDVDTGCEQAARKALREQGYDLKQLGRIRLGNTCFILCGGQDGPYGGRPLQLAERGLVVLHAIVRLDLQPEVPSLWEVTDISTLRWRINPGLPADTVYPRDNEVGPAITWVVAGLGGSFDLNLFAGLVLDPRVVTAEVEFRGGPRLVTKTTDGSYFAAAHIPGQPSVVAVRAWDVAGERLQQTRFL